MANVVTTPEDNLIKTTEMARVREIDFVEMFTGNILPKLMQVLGVTRRIPMAEGTTMYVYKTTGTLQSGAVPEGEIIPLSQYKRTKTPVGEITLNKWRKATTAEAIKKSGLEEAENETDAKLLSDIQKTIRTNFFSFLDTGVTGTTANGVTFQDLLAQHWGQLQVLFEDDAVSPVHFVNPLTVADYLGAAQVSMQTAFGMNYIEDFLGLGTVIMTSQIDEGDVVSTARDNLIMYYITMNGDVANAFNLTADETGLVGIHKSQNDQRAQLETLLMSGIQFLVEYDAGVVKGSITTTADEGGEG